MYKQGGCTGSIFSGLVVELAPDGRALDDPSPSLEPTGTGAPPEGVVDLQR